MLRRYKFAVDGKAARVCKKFCIATLGIGIKTVQYVLKRKQDIDSHRTGKWTHHNKTPEVDIERVRAHIDSFSAMESHYARKKIQLNISEQQLFLMCNTCSTKCPVCNIVSNDWRLLQHISPAHRAVLSKGMFPKITESGNDKLKCILRSNIIKIYTFYFCTHNTFEKVEEKKNPSPCLILCSLKCWHVYKSWNDYRPLIYRFMWRHMRHSRSKQRKWKKISYHGRIIWLCR